MRAAEAKTDHASKIPEESAEDHEIIRRMMGGEMKKNGDSEQTRIILTLHKSLHFLLSISLFFAFWLLFRYRGIPIGTETGFRYNYYILFGYAAALYFFNRTYNSFLLGYSRIRALVFAQFLSQGFALVLIYFVVSMGWDHFHNPLIFLPMLVAQLCLDALWSYFVSWYYYKQNARKKTILIYRNETDKRRFGSIYGKPSERIYHITDEFCFDGESFEEIREVLAGYDAIFVAGVGSRCRNGIVKYCKETNTPGFFLPHVGDVLMQAAVHIQSFDSPVLFVKRTELPPEYALLKRAFDIAASLLGIVIASPIMLVTAAAIRLYDRGPAIYRQTRLTKDGREFEIYKFRSMRVDAEKDGVARLSTGDADSRITPVGRLIRKCRIDELPQLVNILKNDMSFVGPRPERPEIAEQYYESMPDFQLRLQVKAGLTGYAQVYGKYNTDPYEKLEFDLMYINSMNVFTDLQLLFATFAILFHSESTEGVLEGQTTAIQRRK